MDPKTIRENRMILLQDSAFRCCYCREISLFPQSRANHPLGIVKCPYDKKPACKSCEFDAPAFRIIREGSRTHMKPDCGFICCNCGESWLFQTIREYKPIKADTHALTAPAFYTDYRCLRCTAKCCEDCVRFQLLDNVTVPYSQIEKDILDGVYQPEGLQPSSSVKMIPIVHAETDTDKSRRSTRKPKLFGVFGTRKMSIGTPSTFEADLKRQEEEEEARKLKLAEAAVEKEKKRARKEGREPNVLGALHSINALPTKALQGPRKTPCQPSVKSPVRTLPSPVTPKIPPKNPKRAQTYSIPQIRPVSVFNPYGNPEANQMPTQEYPERSMSPPARPKAPQHDPRYILPQLRPVSVFDPNIDELSSRGRRQTMWFEQPSAASTSDRGSESPIWGSSADVPTTIAHYLVHGKKFKSPRDEEFDWY